MNYKTDGRLEAIVKGKKDGKLRVAVGYVGQVKPIYIDLMTVEQFENLVLTRGN